MSQLNVQVSEHSEKGILSNKETEKVSLIYDILVDLPISECKNILKLAIKNIDINSKLVL